MQPAISDAPSDNSLPYSTPAAPPSETSEEAETTQQRNFMVLVLYQVVMRTGWIFKTESIIMPAVLDSIGGAGWLRGCLPLFNRFGQSVPPLLMARRIKVMPRKKWAMTFCTAMMGACFLSLSAAWWIADPHQTRWLPVIFLFFYAVFFMNTGVNQLAFGTLQGKLVRTTSRGRLLLFAGCIGAISAIGFAALLLPMWLRDGGQFGFIFAFTGICFSVSAISSLLLVEYPDNYKQPAGSIANHFVSAARTIRGDANFRRLAIVAALFGSSMMLFPHYQALGRQQIGLTLDHLVWWVILQNAGTALFSFPAGPIADRFGNRLVLRIAILAVCGAPLAAIALAHSGAAGESAFMLVFLLVGLTPVTVKTFNNYTLEICEPEDHPRSLSSLSLCIAAPVFLSPLLGWLVDAIGFSPVFLGVAILVFAGWSLTFGLQEPRHHVSDVPAPIAGD